MADVLRIVLLTLGAMFLVLIIVLLAYFIFDRYYWRVRKLRGVLLCGDSKIRFIWLDKTKKFQGKMNIAEHAGSAYYYTPKQIRRINSYDGLVFYENNFHALTFDEKKLEFDSHQTVHAKIMSEILDAKLISELLEKKLELKDLIIIIGMIVLFIGIVYLIFMQRSQGADITAIKGNMTQMPQNIAAILGR